MRNFYLTLPSNTHGKDSANTTSSFRVHLPHEIQLSGEWEVGIAEIIYPNSWFNVSDEPAGGGFRVKSNEIAVINTKLMQKKVFAIPVNYYSSVEQLLKAIKYAQEEAKVDPFKLAFDEISGRVTFSAQHKYTTVVLSPLLQYLLGFDHIGMKPTDIAHYPPDLRGGIDSLFVYSDIVEPQIVGDTKAPLLRIIPVSGSFSELIDRVFVAPHYVPVLCKQLSTVQITIKTDQDRFVPYQFGKVIVKLHFRKRHML